MALTVPASMEAVIQDFDRSACPFDVHAVQQGLATARAALGQVSDAENIGAWSEVLAFTLVEGRNYGGPSPWGTYFCPFMSVENAAGETVYQPDISKADGAVVDHWRWRARSLVSPVLRARYADLAWDLGSKIAGSRREVEMARLAVDAYVASAHVLSEGLDKFTAVLRALDLAILIQDRERTEQSRAALLRLHREAVDEGRGLWWFACDRLMTEKNAGVTDEERDQLVVDLEGLVLLYGDTSPERFNPRFLQDAAERLIRHYTRLRRGEDVRRLHAAIARAFEHHASLGNALLASAVLQTAVNSYREAGLAEESRRVRMLMEEKIGQAAGEMAAIETEIKIPKDDIEKFLDSVVLADLGQTFVRIAVELLPKRSRLEAAVQKTLEDAPLMALMPMRIMADDHVAGMVGSVMDDPRGRLLQQASMELALSAIWLHAALDRTIQRHQPTPEHFVAWANRLGLFDDVSFLLQGVQAWLDGDLTKAGHVLVPQVERGLRSIVGQLGKPVTKPHPAIRDVGVAVTMGDVLYNDEVAEALGADITLYLLAVYADPRGMNLRNRVAHGQLGAVTEAMVQLVIHTLLIFGIWKELANKRR